MLLAFLTMKTSVKKKELSGAKRVQIFNMRKSVWKEIGSIIKQKKDCSFVEKELLDERWEQSTNMDLECERELETLQPNQERPALQSNACSVGAAAVGDPIQNVNIADATKRDVLLCREKEDQNSSPAFAAAFS